VVLNGKETGEKHIVEKKEKRGVQQRAMTSHPVEWKRKYTKGKTMEEG